MEYKRLYKVKKDKMLAGVCGGFAEYFNIDPSLVRLATVVLGCMGVGVVTYIVAAIILPYKEDLDDKLDVK